MPRVSVILPVYNAEAHLGEAIDSILNQTYKDFELLIYNDGSKDNSEAIIQSYKDERIVYKALPSNKGLIHVLNTGLMDAQGEYIARMDADDLCLPERFQKQVDFMDAHPEVGVCGTQLKVLGDTKTIIKPFDDQSIRWWIFKGTPVAHPSVFIRNSVLKAHDFKFNTKAYVAEDFDLWWRMAFHCHLANLEETLLVYRIHQNQESSSKTETQNENHRKSLEEFISALGIDKKYSSEFIADVLDKNVSLDADNMIKSWRLFNDLLKSKKALVFYGPESISEKRDACIAYQIQNINRFGWGLLPLISNAEFKRLLKQSQVSTSSWVIKSLICWKTR